MKKLLLIAVLALLLVMPLTATNTSIINVDYSLLGNYLNLTEGGGIFMHSVGVSWIHLKAGDSSAGFYSVVNPNVTMFYSRADGTSELIEGLFLNADSILGYGMDLDWGKWGLIFGGGGYIRLSMFMDTNLTLLLFAGIGAAANLYFEFNESVFFNFGVLGAWVPVAVYLGEGFGSGFVYKQYTFTLNTGIGWRY